MSDEDVQDKAEKYKILKCAKINESLSEVYRTFSEKLAKS